jgi:hypothetical protein
LIIMVPCLPKKLSDFVEGAFFCLVGVLFIAFTWFSGNVLTSSHIQFKIIGGFVFCSNIEYV